MQANELKRLQNTLGIAQSELRKVREQYAECNKYCAFLDSITPPEFFQKQAARYEAEWQVRYMSHAMSCHVMQHHSIRPFLDSITPRLLPGAGRALRGQVAGGILQHVLSPAQGSTGQGPQILANFHTPLGPWSSSMSMPYAMCEEGQVRSRYHVDIQGHT